MCWSKLYKEGKGKVVPVLSQALCHKDMGEWRYSSTILDLGTRWRWVVSFTPRPLYSRYSLDGRLGGRQSPSGRYGREKDCRESNSGRPARRYTDWDIATTNIRGVTLKSRDLMIAHLIGGRGNKIGKRFLSTLLSVYHSPCSVRGALCPHYCRYIICPCSVRGALCPHYRRYIIRPCSVRGALCPHYCRYIKGLLYYTTWATVYGYPPARPACKDAIFWQRVKIKLWITNEHPVPSNARGVDTRNPWAS
jgi:hypothetical protein